MLCNMNMLHAVSLLLIAAWASQADAAPHQHHICLRGDQAYTVGANWSERCRECTCNGDATECKGPQCTLPYVPEHEYQCAEWEEDGCCCRELGCKLDNGTLVPVGHLIPQKDNPCVSCRCHEPGCLAQECDFIPNCFDVYKPEGQCCEVCRAPNENPAPGIPTPNPSN